MHRQFSKNLLKILNIFKLFAMIEEILFILHVVDGIYIITRIQIQILFCQFLENGNSYRVRNFMVNKTFNELSNHISHFVVA